MELSQEFLIDMGINAIGYLIAGVVSVLFYVMIKKRKSAVKLDLISEDDIISQSDEMDVKSETTSGRKVEFITFGGKQQHQNIDQLEIKIEQPQEQNKGRMNRKEAINLAKRMLLAGATHEKIKKILPVSESELALLSLNNK